MLIYTIAAFSNEDSTDGMRSYRYIVNILDCELSDLVLTCMLQILFYMLFFVGYYHKRSGKAMSYINRVPKHDAVVLANRFGNICLGIGATCTLIYMLAYGSITEALKLSSSVRSYIDNATDHIGYLQSLMIIPAGIILVAPYCFLYVRNHGKTIVNVRLAASVIVSVLFLLVKAGRAPLIIFLISLVIPFLGKFVKHPWIVILIGGIILLPLLDWMEGMFIGQFGHNLKYNYNVFSYISQFSYPFSTSLKIFDIILQFGLRYGVDFATSIIGLIPGFNFDTSWMITSEYYAGPRWKIYGSVPMDLYSFSIIQFHVLGVVIGFVIGIVSRLVDGAFRALDDDSFSMKSIESVILLDTAWRVSTADFHSIIRSIFLVAICLVIVLITRRNKSMETERA